jgi:hypothetical protein
LNHGKSFVGLSLLSIKKFNMRVFYSVVIFLFVVLTGCDRVVFDEPQPVKGRVLSTIPKMYLGVYQSSNLHLELKKDAIVVNGLSFALSRELPTEGTTQLRFYDNLYFANVGDSTGYSVFMAQFFDDKLAVYMLNPDGRSLSRIKRVAQVSTLETSKPKRHKILLSKNNFFELVDSEMFDVVSVLHYQY